MIASENSIENDFPVIRILFQIQNTMKENIITKNDIFQTKEWFLKICDIRDRRRKDGIKKIEMLFAEDRPIVFYGAGGDMYDLGDSNKEILSKKIFHIVDSNPNKCGKLLNGVEIENPEIIFSLHNPIICITSRLVALKESIRESILELKIEGLDIRNLFENHD